ncbi:MAG TPA: DNA phosphorothioation-associated putative methyltransferase [Microthrixaceae bacterium]|nr:DNA phosphorothioation-associated putative methyltransferase [Microthrixaceae bacterium]HMT24437.1 DNA phosphorothioation-associated putative methyltransferase [Microthrixaceae bacterium]HMT60868.1 DNA phosphorothioation-associated putative methyltransferase [Microthrixaceae bacterium]
MSRTDVSRPVQTALADGVLRPERSFFDYGCGKGGDVERLSRAGFDASGWDPAHAPAAPVRPADVVNLGYVVNVIEDRRERAEVLRQAWDLARSVLVIAARPDWEAGQLRGQPRGDGLMTSKGTFQKFFAQDELRDWIAAVVGRDPVAAAPGIFYVFRNETEAAGVRVRRFRTRALSRPRPRRADALWDEHRPLLEPLAEFWESRGRLPDPSEIEQASEIAQVIGSLRSAAGVLRRVLGDDRFEVARRAAEADLIVFLALEAFRGRPKFGELPDDLQRDVRAHFGTYKAACIEADENLFALADEHRLGEALRKVPFGKILPDSVYVHADYIDLLPPLLRIYEGAGRALLGTVEDVAIVKLSRVERRISYLSYPTFEKEAHPPLATSLRADLRSLRVKWRDFRESENPPILHRKETFVPEVHPTRAKFERLTRHEERAGLLDEPTTIGTRSRWQALLVASGYELRGHRLLRVQDQISAGGGGDDHGSGIGSIGPSGKSGHQIAEETQVYATPDE